MIEVSYKPAIKIFVMIILILGIYLSYYVGVGFFENGKLYHIAIISFPILAFCVWGLFYLFRFKIVVTESYVESHGLSTKKIEYSKVDHIYLYENEFIIRAKKSRIKITSDLKRQKEVINFITSKLKGNEEIKVTGDRAMIEAFLL